MRTFTFQDICDWYPHGGGKQFIPTDWSGTVLNLLRDRRIPIEVRYSVGCHDELTDAKVKRKFAILCAKRVEHLVKDDRLLHGILVSERFVNGQANEEELQAACVEAKNAREAVGDLIADPEHDAAVNASNAAYYAAVGNIGALYPTARAVTDEAAMEAIRDEDDDDHRYHLEWSEALESVWYGVFHLYVAKLANLIRGK
jgi:hypothetical protein